MNEQPLGFAETLSGAQNRCMSLDEKYSNKNNVIVVGIESGIVERDGSYHEVVAICINNTANLTRSCPTEEIMMKNSILIPEKFEVQFMLAVRTNKFSIPFGKMLEKEYGLERDTWHEFVTEGQMSRQEQIKRTMVDMLKEQIN